MKAADKQDSTLRKFIVYAAPGSAVWVDEEDDGAKVTVGEKDREAQVELDATQLMKLTRQLADLFGHVLVHPTEWRDQLVKVITETLERNEARCLDDEIDRRVVLHELVGALAAAALPKAR